LEIVDKCSLKLAHLDLERNESEKNTKEPITGNRVAKNAYGNNVITQFYKKVRPLSFIGC
jgi:hypothetical protein